MELNTILITQARLGSKRLPKKVMLEISNKSLLEIHLERLKQAKEIDKIIVASTTNKSDELIYNNANTYVYNIPLFIIGDNLLPSTIHTENETHHIKRCNGIIKSYIDTSFCFIIPVYNYEKYIKKCLASIESQYYTNWRAIIIFDACTDNTMTVATDFIKEYMSTNEIDIIASKSPISYLLCFISSANVNSTSSLIASFIDLLDTFRNVEPTVNSMLLKNVLSNVLQLGRSIKDKN